MIKNEIISHEVLHESIINNSDDAIISKTLDGIILSWNKAAEKIFGYTAEEIIGKHISILVPEHHINEDKEIIIRIKAGGKINHYETERLKKDGSIIHISLTVSPLKNKEGSIIGAFKIARDITERKEKIDNLIKLVKEIADYKYALDESCIVAITDQKGIINYVNDNFCSISGYSREELIGQDHSLINSGYHDAEFIRNLWVTVANGKIWRGEFKNKTKEGSFYWVDTTIVPFLNNNGKPFQYVAIRSDITSSKVAEEKNLQITHRYIQVVENIHDGLIITDLNGKILFANNQFLHLFGFSEAGLSELNITDLFEPGFYEDLKVSIGKNNRSSGKGFALIEYVARRKNSKKVWMEVRYCKVIENGKVSGWQFALRDITKQKTAEAERKKAIEDIVQRNKDLEQFSYIVSHNLRAPVANILGITDLLIQGGLADVEKAFLIESLSFSTKKLDGIIIDLNHVTQIKRSSNEHKEVILFSELVSDILTSISYMINKREVSIIVDFSEIDAYFSVKSYIYSIFFNLITNCVKYKKPNDPLICEIRSRKLAKTIELTFSDNGIGIDLIQAGDQIFEIYKRFHFGSVDGKGLGLFMVKNHVESLNGKIRVSSELNKGTEFKIELPIPPNN